MSNGNALPIVLVAIGAAVAGAYLSGPGNHSGIQPITSVSDIATSLASGFAQLTGMRLDPTEHDPIEDRRGEDTNGDLADQLGPPEGGAYGQAGGEQGRDPPMVDPSQAHGRRLGCWDSRRHQPVSLSFCQQAGNGPTAARGGGFPPGEDYAQGSGWTHQRAPRGQDEPHGTPPIAGSVWCSGHARGNVWRDDPNCPRSPSGRFKRSDWGER